MAFKWIHYWELAQKLCNELPNQHSQITDIDVAAMRSIISRAYYAAYWCARNYLLGEYGFRPTGGDVHDKVVREMREHCSKLAGVGEQLHRLKNQRAKADYDIKERFNKAAAESAVLQAQMIMDRLNDLGDCP